MSRYRARLRRLEDSEKVTAIPQPDGSVHRYSRAETLEALRAWGKDVPEPHPLVAAAQNSSDPEWRNSLVYSGFEVLNDGSPVEDLSEQAGAG